MHIVKNSKNVDLAAAYINAALSPEVQSKMADAPYFVAPISSKAVFSKGLQTYAADMKALEAMNGVDWAKLETLAPREFDRYWELTLKFLRIATTIWPDHLRDVGRMDRAERQVRLIDQTTAIWGRQRQHRLGRQGRCQPQSQYWGRSHTGTTTCRPR
jgi:inactivated superfamily I helicase